MSDRSNPDPLPRALAAPVRTESVVRKSRFIADLAPVEDAEGGDTVIAAARREFHDARHHCTAMVLGLDRSEQRSNDDGEPAGTAGAPMLAVLRASGLTDVIAVVTRYFGGTLLGAGGLVRAYSESVSSALEQAHLLDRRRVALLTAATGHADAGRLEHLLRTWSGSAGASIGTGRYTAAGAEFDLTVPTTQVEALHAALAASGITHRLQHLGEDVEAITGQVDR